MDWDYDEYHGNEFDDDPNPNEVVGPYDVIYLRQSAKAVLFSFKEEGQEEWVAFSLFDTRGFKLTRFIEGRGDVVLSDFRLLKPDRVYQLYPARWWAEANGL